jgi:hypothetical protein
MEIADSDRDQFSYADREAVAEAPELDRALVFRGADRRG